MSASPQPAQASADSTVVQVILAVALGHFLNDLMQSLIPAAYPLLKDNLALSFAQVGLITFVFHGTASVLQPLVGLYTDRRPLPYAMAVGAMTVLPFILFKPVWWFLTAPIWYGLARLATKVNPNGHHVFAVKMQVTPIAILRKGRRHVS